MECSVGNVLTRTGCIFSYNGSTQDVVLNYFVLAVNLAYCVPLLLVESRKRQTIALGCFGGLVFVQWSLCLLVECSGISIIWCAMCGFIMTERRRKLGTVLSDLDESQEVSDPPLQQNYVKDSWAKGIIFFNLAVIFYYSIVMEALTTIAHVSALILGASLDILATNISDGSNNEESSAPLLGGRLDETDHGLGAPAAAQVTM